MRKSTMVTGLDIGSSKIVAVAMDELGRIMAYEFQPSKGILKGGFADLNDAASSVSKVLARLKEKISRRPENIYVNISGQTLKGERSKGMIPISLRGREITKADMDRCMNVASTIRLPFDRDIVHRVAQSFSIDDQPWIRNPISLYASRLSCEAYIITVDVNHIQNIYKCVNNAGYDVAEAVFTGIADGESLFGEDEKEGGAVLLDMGSHLTELSVFSGGALKEMEVFAATCRDSNCDYFRKDTEFISMISTIKSRIAGHLNNTKKIATVTLTGGVAFADGVVEYLEEALVCPVKMGMIRDPRGDISSLDSIRAVTAIGLARYALKKQKKRISEEGGIAKRLSSKVVDIFNNYF